MIVKDILLLFYEFNQSIPSHMHNVLSFPAKFIANIYAGIIFQQVLIIS